MNFLNIFAKLSLDSSEYEQGLNDSEKDAQSFGSKLKSGLATAGKVAAGTMAAVGTAAAAAGTVMVKQAGAVAAYGDNIDKMSQKMGMSTDAYQEWDAILQHSGTSIESMKTGMKTLAAAAETGSDAFTELGLSQEEISNMSQEELFGATIKALQGVEDETKRTYLASQLLGKGGTELGALLNTSAEDTEKMRQRVHELGGVMSEEAVKSAAAYQDSLQDMQTALGGVKNSIVSEFLPGITSVMDGLTEIFAGNAEEGGSILTQGVENVLTTLQEAIPKVIEIGGAIVSSLFNALMENIPQIAQGGTEILISLVNAVVTAIPKLIPAAVTMIKTIVQTLMQNLPQLLETGRRAVAELAGGMNPQTLVDKGGELLNKLVDKILAYLPKMLDSGVKFIDRMSNGITKSLPQIINSISGIITSLIQKIMQRLPEFMQKGVQMITHMVSGISEMLPEILSSMASLLGDVIGTIMDNLPQFLEQGIELVGEMASGIGQNLPTIISAMVEALVSLVAEIATHLPDFLEKGIELVGEIAAGVIQAIPDVVDGAWELITGIVDEFGNYDWLSIGSNIISGIIDGLWDMAGSLWDAIVGVVDNAWGGLLNWLGIASPSKKARDQIGKNWSKGIGIGFEQGMPVDDMVSSVEDAFKAVDSIAPPIIEPTVEVTSTAQDGAGSPVPGAGMFAPVFNIYGAEGQDINALADVVMDRITFAYRQETAAYA